MTSETTQHDPTGADPTRPQVTVPFNGAATPIVAGLGAMLAAVALYAIGLSVAANSWDGSGGGGWMVVATLVGLGGAVYALCGLYFLLRHVDDWARSRQQQRWG